MHEINVVYREGDPRSWEDQAKTQSAHWIASKSGVKRENPQGV